MKQLNSTALRRGLHWRVMQLTERTGRVPLALSALPVCLLGLWLGVMNPQTQQKQEALATIQLQLRPILPLAQQQPDLQKQLGNITWQQVKVIFDQLKQLNISVEASQYQLMQQDGEPVLQLDIPLKGEYMPLMRAIELLSRTLPLKVTHLSLQRTSPDVALLTATIQLQLKMGAK